MGDFIRTHRPFLKRSKRTQILLSGSNTSLNVEKQDTGKEPAAMGRRSIKEKEKRHIKRGSTKERWLLTRKTWKYMTDAGRRLIPEGLANKAEDVPKIEEYFQEVCRNEPRFLIWKRKCSYPGALATPGRRRRRLKKGHSSLKSGSADEADDEILEQKEVNQQEELMIDLLKRYLNITDEEMSFRQPISTSSSTSSIVTSSSTTTTSKTSSIPLQFVSTHTKPNISPHLPKLQPTLQSIDESRRNTSSTSRYGPGGTASKNLLYDSLVKYSKTNRMSPLSAISEKLTPEVLTDKIKLRQIYDELRQHQINRMLKKTSQLHHKHQHPLGLHSLSNLSLFGRLGHGRNDAKSTSIEIHLSKTVSSSNSDFRQDQNVSLKAIQDSQRENSETGEGGVALKQHESSEAQNLSTPVARRVITYETQGTQTEVIPEGNLKELSTKYRQKCEEEEKQRLEDELYEQQQQEQQKPEPSSRSLRRKSSIDNEDVSQSVSDTIKRYLRMARKKSSKDDQVNRFKRINYDRNLRNIKAKGELSMPGDDDGNMKGCQTNEDWIVHSLDYLTKLSLNPPIITEDKPVRPTTLPRWKTGSKNQLPSPTSLSSPSSPGANTSANTGLFHSSTQFLSNLFHSDKPHSPSPSGGSVHSNQDVSLSDAAAMQKSKSSSNVGHLVSKKIWKSRSKSQTRPTSPVKPQWTPQGNCVWTSAMGRHVQLAESALQYLTEVERKVLQQVAIDKISQFNIGVNVTIPVDNGMTNAVQKPQKRRALLLKRKALTTSFFDTSKGTSKSGSAQNESGGLMFGLSLEQCLDNDNRQNKLQKSSTTDKVPSSAPSGSCESLPSRGVIGQDVDTGTLLKSSLSQFDVRRGSQDEEDLTLAPPVAGLERTNGNNVPSLVVACVQHLEKYGLHTVGIFRKSTSKKRVRQLREDFDHGTVSTLDPDVCPHDVATLLKEYLRDLKEPLLCRNLYQAFVNTQKIRNRRLQMEALSHLVQLLPVAHRDTLFYLLRFLAKVARFSDDLYKNDGSRSLEVEDETAVGNKMDSNNLATVFAPNILHNSVSGQATTDQEVDERIDVINVIRTMIDHYEELFRIPPDLMDEIYTNMIDTYPSQLDYLCDCRDMSTRQQQESELSDIGTLSPTSPPAQTTMTTAELLESHKQRRIYAREEFLHEHSASTGARRRERPKPDQIEPRRRNRELGDEWGENSSLQRHSDKIVTLKNRSSSIDSESPVFANMDFMSNRRMSSPYELNNILTASLKIPVQVQPSQNHQRSTAVGPLNIVDVSDIPFIEDSGYGPEDRDSSQSSTRSSRRGFSQMLLSRDRSSRKSSSGTVTGTLSLVQSPSLTLSPTTSNSTSPDQTRNSLSSQMFFNDDFCDNHQVVGRSSITGSGGVSSPAETEVRKSNSLLAMTSTNKKSFETKKPTKQKLSIAQPIAKSVSSAISAAIPEPKFSPSISQIGGAVMRSKTADFERIMVGSKKIRQIGDAGQSRGEAGEPSPAPRTYKRREIISSAQSSAK